MSEELSDDERIERLVRELIDFNIAEPNRTVVQAWLSKRIVAAQALTELGVSLE